MSDDLVKRLRQPTGLNAFTQEPVQNKLNVAAADRIEELEAERNEQIEWVKRLADDLIAAEAKLAKALAELERLGFDFESIVGRKLKGQDDE